MAFQEIVSQKSMLKLFFDRLLQLEILISIVAHLQARQLGQELLHKSLLIHQLPPLTQCESVRQQHCLFVL